MLIYLAGEVPSSYMEDDWISELWKKSVKRRLLSFFYHGYSGTRFKQSRPGVSVEVDRAMAEGLDLFLDSGAFSAFTKGVSIPVEEYGRYVKWTKRAWTTCSSLDAIGSGEKAARKSYEYFCRLRELGAEVQPVFHVREPDHWLQRYIDEGWDYIFIGGMVIENTRWLKPRLDGLWERILSNPDGTPKVKTHGFGLTDQQLMFRYPWHSIDSTSWLMTGIFGACLFRDGQKLTKVVFSEESPEARKFKGWHYGRLPREARDIVDGWLEPFNVTAEDLAAHYRHRNVINAALYQGLEDLGTDRFVLQQPTLFGGLENDELDDEAAE